MRSTSWRPAVESSCTAPSIGIGDTVDFLLTAQRDLAAAKRFFERAVSPHDLPVSITIDESGANTAALNSVIADTGSHVLLCQSKYLNNQVEPDHRAVKRITRPSLGFKAVTSAARIVTGNPYLQVVGSGAGEQIGTVREVVAEDLDHAGQLGIDVRAQVQRIDGEPDRVDASRRPHRFRSACLD